MMKQKTIDFFNQFNLNKTNILLGRANALLAFSELYEYAYAEDIVNNILITLPFPTYHHSNFATHFKGQLLENDKHPFVITQSKEFLENIILLPEDTIVSTDFNIIQLSYNENSGLTINTISNEQAKEKLLSNPNIEFRDF